MRIANIHIGIDWLASVSFGHTTRIGRRVIVLGGGNTAMDCCRSARRLGADDVKVVVRSGFDEMKASPWEKEDAMHEGIPIVNWHVPKAVLHEGGRLTGMAFEIVRAECNAQGRRRLVPTGEPDAVFACDDVLVAIGQENAFPWIERDAGIAFDRHGLPVLDAVTLQSSLPRVFFGGDAAFGPAHRNFKRPRGRRSAAGLEGLELAELTPGLLLWSDSTGSRRFARSSFGIDIRVSPWFVGIELTCGAAPPWLRWQRTLVQDSSDGRRGPGGFSPAPPRVPALWVAAADPAPGG